MKENACPEGGRGGGPGQPEMAEKHRKCLQKRGKQVKRFTRLPPFSLHRAVLGGPGGCLRRPGRPGGAPWETLRKHWETQSDCVVRTRAPKVAAS